MLRTTLLSLILLVSLSSTTLLRKTISRRQSDPTYCQAIEGFDCQCSSYRITCTTDRDLPQQLNVLAGEQHKYPSVELIINGERDHNVNDYTFEPVKQLFKPDSDNLECRIKFEKFTGLHLSSPGVFNRIFPENASPTARKHLALEIYNPLVQPNDNVNLFANLNIDSLELYVLYPFRGTFQQLFAGANVKYLRLSGGDIKSDLSQPFTGNIGRLELAKQAGQLNVQNFPIYPAHELIIDAFYVTDFNSDNPPNYSNLGELRIYSQERIPANAFRNYPNLHTLSVTTEKDIDPHAFVGLNNLEKLTIKDTKPSLEILNSLPSLKEFHTNLEKLDDREQCQLIEKLGNGQIAVQALSSGRECTCASAYLDAATGRYPCDAQNCDQSSCATIKNNYDATTRTFKAPPTISRLDGSNALHQRESKLYTAPFQITRQDQEKVQQSAPQQTNDQQGDEQQQQQQDSATQAGQTRKRRPKTKQPTTPNYDQHQNPADGNSWQSGQADHPYHPDKKKETFKMVSDYRSPTYSQHINNIPGTENEYPPKHFINPNEWNNGKSQVPWDYESFDYRNPNANPNEVNDQQPSGDGGENQQGGDDTENPQAEKGAETGQGEGGEHEHHPPSDPNQSKDAASADMAESSAPPPKKGLGWLPIILIIAAIAGLLLIGLIILLIRKRRASGYNAAATNDTAAPRA
ncbi:unnamed protein product [Adineta steineri]|uniref:Uncharacterized protein n=1 Tax=Adineta steineri TaxID=433720 RepID=A0A818TA87_9BILA|nr:unnamed protein product [Adineta steineri]CAF3684185.1 unnamed protein product [Adineta steineri]